MKFDRDLTREEPFWVEPERAIPFPMMRHGCETALYASIGPVHAIRLPYTGYDLSMMIVLPEHGKSLEEIRPDLTPALLAQLSTKLIPQKTPPGLSPQERAIHSFPCAQSVIAVLPRFGVRANLDLGAPLGAMGMLNAFDEAAADFSGMDGRKNWLYIHKALHEVYIEVNEEGTEAAAVTGIFMEFLDKPRAPVTFRADRPFLFFILEEQTGSILFMGRLADPSI